MSRFRAAFRFVLIALLMVGVLAQPVFAAACKDCEETPAAFDGTTSHSSGDSSPDGDCCSIADCNECCAQAVALRLMLDTSPVVPESAPAVAALAVDFEPMALGVAFRPPIAS